MTQSMHLVIRSAGERTTDCCRRIAERQLPAGCQLSVVHEVPFEKALRRSYQIGLESGCKWLMTLDADVLLLPEAIQGLMSDAEAMPQHFFQIEGRVFDKITGRYRPAGHRFYRVSYLEKAFALIPSEGEQIRPESKAISEMIRLGHPSRVVPRVVGVHDCEQHFHDLYRKAFIHSRKSDYAHVEIFSRCVEKRLEDPDFAVILRGLCDGLLESGKYGIDVRGWRERSQSAFAYLGLGEKAQLQHIGLLGKNEINAYMEGDVPFGLIIDRGESVQISHPSRSERFRLLVERRGWINALGSVMAAFLERLSAKLKG